MKLAVLTSTVSRKAGGLFESVRHLHKAMAASIPTTVMSLRDRYTAQDLPVWSPLEVRTFASIGPRALGHSPSMSRALEQLRPDILHVHGIWQGPSIACSAYHARTGRPHVVSPRGMLDPWALRNSQVKKRIAAFCFENKHLRKAACLHALCKPEADAIRAFGLRNPVAVIPNGVALPDRGQDTVFHEPERRTLLFLGRIHPKKGLINALRAWKQAVDLGSGMQGREDWQFVIAGWDQGGHEAELKNLCEELGLTYADVKVSELSDSLIPGIHSRTSVLFTGPAFGEAKDKLLRAATAFILPSFSEGLPMSVLEAWAYHLPVLMTDSCNLPEGFATEAAFRIGNDAESIAEGMRAILGASRFELQSIGKRGRTLVEERFTWTRVAVQVKAVYEWLLGGGVPPDCMMIPSSLSAGKLLSNP